jgi:hypothetical protein
MTSGVSILDPDSPLGTWWWGCYTTCRSCWLSADQIHHWQNPQSSLTLTALTDTIRAGPGTQPQCQQFALRRFLDEAPKEEPFHGIGRVIQGPGKTHVPGTGQMKQPVPAASSIGYIDMGNIVEGEVSEKAR